MRLWQQGNTQRHNNAQKTLTTEWRRQEGIIGQEIVWYKEKWEQGKVIDKISWDFEFNLRKTETARRPDLVLEHRDDKKITVIDTACPNEKNINETYNGNFRKYKQLVSEFRERRPGFRIEMCQF